MSTGNGDSSSSGSSDGGGGGPGGRQEPNRAPIRARNLTALDNYRVPGNPVVTQLQDAVANCFPGLEFDVRNLDRRFFPGLVFEFDSEIGARLAYVDVFRDPDLQHAPGDTEPFGGLDGSKAISVAAAQKLRQQLLADRDALGSGTWYLSALQTAGGRISGDDFNDGMLVWRFVRGLRPCEDVTIRLEKRHVDAAAERSPDNTPREFKGWRRRYADADTGVLSGAYQPGELMQGLCSPWQHDFRDCACHYWAANHPDIVLGEAAPSGRAGDELLEDDLPLDWLRADRERNRRGAARESFDLNRPYQLDHFQINQVWQKLNVVVEGREIGGVYVPPSPDTAIPFKSPEELFAEVTYLAQLELTLTFEYLYARLSVLESPAGGRQDDVDLGTALDFVRRRLLLIAMDEMQHLRLTNQILLELVKHGLVAPPYRPVLSLATWVPKSDIRNPWTPPQQAHPGTRQQARRAQVEAHATVARKAGKTLPAPGRPATDGECPAGFREPRLRPFTPKVIDDFTGIEHRMGFIDRAYSRVVATLRLAGYPRELVGLTLRIVGEGVQHEQGFHDMRRVLRQWEGREALYLRRPFDEALLDAPSTTDVATSLGQIFEGLFVGYLAQGTNQPQGANVQVQEAHAAMIRFDTASQILARSGQGVPFFKIWSNLQP